VPYCTGYVSPPAAKVSVLSDKKAFQAIANASGSFPTPHDYAYDIASVVGKQAPGHAKNTNPSANQFASFGYAYSQFAGKGAAKNPALAHWMDTKLAAVFPHKPGAWPLSVALGQVTGLARRMIQANVGQSGGADEDSSSYAATYDNLQAAFDVSGYSSKGNVPNAVGNNSDQSIYSIKAAGTSQLRGSIFGYENVFVAP
jgi:hypothetical protein